MAWKFYPRIYHMYLRKGNDFSGGLNTGNQTLQIGDNQSTDEYGWDTDQFPALHTRKGHLPYGTSGVAETNLLTNFNTTHLVRAVGTALQYNSSGTTWTGITGTFTDTDWDSTNFEVVNPVLLLTNGTDNVKKWDGTTLSDLNAATAPKGKYITNDTIRVWIAKGDILYYSAFEDATDWTTVSNSGFVQYFTPDGGNITGLRNFYGDKYIWKLDSFASVLGTDYFNYKIREISNQIGCVSFKTIQEVQTPSNSALFWLGQNDVYMFTAGLPTPIGQSIRSYLNSINTTYWSRCFGATDGLRYYLGLVTGANTQPDTLLIYDPRYKIWRIASLGDNFRYSALINNVWFVGDAAGQTFKMNQGTNDNGTAISWSITSKAFDEGSPEAEKEYTELFIQSYLPAGSTMNVYASVDDRGTNFTLIDTLTGSTVAQNTVSIVPFDTVPMTHWIRYKLTGSGEATIYSVERTANIQPIRPSNI